MQSVRIGVVRGRRFRASDGFHVYGRGPAGEMDWDHSVSARRVLLWPDAVPMGGHLCGGHVLAAHLDVMRPDGHLEGTHLLDDRLHPAAAVFFDSPPHVFGRFQYGIVLVDEAGNRQFQDAVMVEQVINSEPVPARGLKPVHWDMESGRMTFRFRPSERLVG